jgi:hypothetical protein
MPTVRLDQFDCRDLIKRLDLIARSQRNRLFGVTYNFKHASKTLSATSTGSGCSSNESM